MVVRSKLAFVVLALGAVAACSSTTADDSEATAGALSSRHFLVVGDPGEPSDGGPGDDGLGAAADGGVGSVDEDSDDLAEPTPSERARSSGALVRPVRRASAAGTCVLAPGRYELEGAPRVSDADPTFTHVAFARAVEGIGGEPCGKSGWVETSAVRFEQRSVAGSPPTGGDGDSREGATCGADPSFRPQFIKPVVGPITGNFGDCRDGCRRTHAGIDIAAATGTPLKAPEDGVVIDVGTGRGACGTVVEVRHPNGSSTRFCHNHRLFVKKGDCVTKGQKIAEVGNTGIGTGPHMHMEYYPKPTGGAANPRPIFGY